MPALDARSVASLLREYAQRTALRGGNPYRAKAYARAAGSLTMPLCLCMCSSPKTGLRRYPGSAMP